MSHLKNHIIAITDDDMDDREIFLEVCNAACPDINVLVFENGDHLLQHLKNPEKTDPAILFLDINMPKVNGFDCLRKIRESQEFDKLCIIMYSTSVSQADVNKAKELGADGFLQKPCNYSRLMKSIEKILETDWTDPCAEIHQSNFLITA